MDSPRPEVGSVGAAESGGHELPVGAQKQAANIQTALPLRWSSPIARPVIVGAPLLLLLLSKLPEGVLWGPIEVPSVTLGVVAFACFVGSVVVGGALNLARIIAPTPQHYLSVLEAWLLCRLNQLPRKQYHQYVAVRIYQRFYGSMPAELRPETQEQFVRCVVHERGKMKRQKRSAKRSRSGSGPPSS